MAKAVQKAKPPGVPPQAVDTGTQVIEPARAEIIHYNGGWIRPFQPGKSGNPGGYGGRYVEVRKLAAEASPEAMRDLIKISRDPMEDGRVRVVAIQTILERGLGKVRENDPKEMDPQKPDLSKLTEEERGKMAELLRKMIDRSDG